MSFQSLFMFNRKQQRGIFVLIVLILKLIAIRYYLSQQPKKHIQLVDVSQYQREIDSLKKNVKAQRSEIHPFNPNYITEYRAYTIGLNDQQLSKLERFRESGKFINSAAQFRNVTGVSKSWMDSLSTYFKFPEWANKQHKSYPNRDYSIRKIGVKDINLASLEELRAVYGIGSALSQRILEKKNKLGGFIHISQLNDVYGLSDSTIIQLQKHFTVNEPLNFQRLALNKASKEELLSIPYFNEYLVEQLIKQRTLREGFKSWDKVVITSRFPKEKLPLIRLYLTLD